MKNHDALYTVVNSDTNTIVGGMLSYDEAKYEFFRMHSAFPNRQLIGWPGGSWQEAQALIADKNYKRCIIISAEAGRGWWRP